MEAGPEYDPSLIENIFQEFKDRRAGLIKALTTDVEEFFQQCDPEKENLCLYGFPKETWKVSLPAAEVPPEIPEPVLGINFNRDKMSKKEWLTFVAVHSDSWLHSVVFNSAFNFGASKSDRARLFRKINDLSTVSETVRGSFEKPSKEKSSATIHKSDTSQSPSGSKYKRGEVWKSKMITNEPVEEEVQEGGELTRGFKSWKQVLIQEYYPVRVETIFQDFKGRRAGLIKALTTDVKELFQLCDPEKDNLCLYGLPNGTWEVTLPAEEIPPEIPEPALGVNFARDGMTKPEKKWLTFVAIRSDSWLLSVAFHSVSRFSVCKSDRARLFSMINGLPTVSETVRWSFEKPSKEDKSSATTYKRDTSKSTSGSKKGSDSDIRASRGRSIGGGDVEEQDEDIMCGKCNKDYSTECEFWIFCHTCENWFHSECVNITQASVPEIKQYKCPSCCRRP